MALPADPARTPIDDTSTAPHIISSLATSALTGTDSSASTGACPTPSRSPPGDLARAVNANQHKVNRLAGDGIHDRETIRHTTDLGHR
jgi:hypothetical protein